MITRPLLFNQTIDAADHKARHSKFLTIAALGMLTMAFGNAAHQPAPKNRTRGQTRTYYIAADELDWDYAPSGTDQIHGEKFHFQDDPGSKGTLNPNATTYRKALFREYTDATFGTLKPRPDAWAHLGVLGPLIRAEVGDTITVVFKNNASRAYSIHPHGVFYTKDAEGAGYQDGSSDSDKKDDAVAPGGTYSYVWTVPERAGPTSAEGSTALWLYHSHVDAGFDRTAADHVRAGRPAIRTEAGGSGDITVEHNTVSANNSVCPEFEGFLPDLGGGGIVLAGSQHDTISHNLVTDNRGNTLFSGGIVLITNTLPNPDGSFDVSKDNLVARNRLSANEPADIVTDAASTPNVFVGNRCDTSIPDGLCSF
jgi:Multicopper oxidase/Right handed beta helix region